MRRIYFLALMPFLAAAAVTAQTISGYNKQEVMIPMRDGVKLYTVIFTPKEKTAPLPILLTRTPYSASVGDSFDMLKSRSMADLAREGYIFVYQDIRGKYKSEGKMQIHQPIVHQEEKGAVDESTDTYDAIDWLIANVPNNNGRAGIMGISYPGWLALVGAVDAHPALKA
ncbi:MAG TPA: CocE/NonD family hydrolase, partial [Chryseosolibacter sp.]